MEQTSAPLAQQWQTLRARFFTRRNRYYAYLLRFGEASLELGLHGVGACVFTLLLLVGLRGFWFFFSPTLVGQDFAVRFPERALFFVEIVGNDLLATTFSLTATSLVTALAVAVVAQLLHLSRFFYYGRGLFHRLFCWGLPLTLLVAGLVREELGLASLAGAFLLALPPVLTLYPGCFRFSGRLLPEIQITVKRAYRERTPTRSRLVAGAALVGGYLAFMVCRLLIEPVWQEAEWREIMLAALDAWPQGYRFEELLAVLLYHLPQWGVALLLGLGIGLLVLPPWQGAALLCATGYLLPPFLLYGASPWYLHSQAPWPLHFSLHLFSLAILLPTAWLCQKSRPLWIIYQPCPSEGEPDEFPL